MKKLYVLFPGLLSLFFVYSCSYDNEEDFYDQRNCDIEIITFSETIDPILDQNCKSCHYSGNGTGITLDTYDDIQDVAESGKLLGAIKHLPGYDPMPQGGKLDDCSINQIETWISNGIPNN